MSHVDDGLIHAWLDGALLPGDPERVALEAHLAACDECRARVEAGRILRDRATDVMRSAAPDATRVEPFEQMIAARRAKRAAEAAVAASVTGAAAEPETVPGRVDFAVPGVEAPSRRRRGLLPLAWAASLMMAVSAGWFARQYLPPAATGLRQYELPQAAEPDIASGEGLTQSAIPSEKPVAGAAVDARALVPPPSAPAARAVDAADPAGRVAAESAQMAKLEAEAGVTSEAVSGGVRRPTEETRRLADAMVLDETRTRAQAAAPGFATGSVPPDSEVSAVLASAAAARWEAVSEMEAKTRLGIDPARIEGVTIDSIQAARHANGWLVRVVQRIGPDGATAEILQWQQALALNEAVVTGVAAEAKRTDDRSGAAANSAQARAERQAALAAVAADRPAPAPPRDRPTLPLSRIGFGLLLRADVSADSLKALAARIR